MMRITIRNLTGTYRNKLVFRNDVTGNLVLLDFHSSVLSLKEFDDSLEVFHPDISPNGNLVAFCTGLEGVRGKSSLYVRSLENVKSSAVKLDVESAAIPRWRVTESGDTVIVYVTDAGNNKENSDFLSASTWLVPFSDGKFGTPQKLFDGAYHGGISSDNSLAVSGARLLRARYTPKDSGRAFVDTVWYNSEQACNVSLAMDGTKRTLFLDFGGSTGKEFVGEEYGTHERLLILDSLDQLKQLVKAPAGFSFDHSEWVNLKYPGRNGGLVVVSLANANGSHRKISLVDLGNGSIYDLVEGEEIWHPCFWTSVSGNVKYNPRLSMDSAGVYLSKNHELMQSKFRVKMDRFWKNLDSIQMVAMGSSRMEMGLISDSIPKRRIQNMAVTGIDFNRDMKFIEDYVFNHSKNIKVVMLSLDPDGWRGDADFDGVIRNGAPGYKYDKNHGFWKDSIPEGFADAVVNAYPAETDVEKSYTSLGSTYSPSRSWQSEGVQIAKDSVFSKSQLENVEKLLDHFVNFIDSAARLNIKVIGVLFPLAPQYRNTGSYGPYGMKRSIAKQKLDWLDSLQQKKKNFILMDENKMGNHDYTDEMAYNMDHLSSLGAKQLTTRLDSLLRTLE